MTEAKPSSGDKMPGPEIHYGPTLQIYATEDATIPRYMTAGSSGFDMSSASREDIIIYPGGFTVIPTGIHMAIKPGFEVQLRPRSGLSIKHGITLINSPSTIDSDYRGEVQIPLVNHGREPFTVVHGMRIAQGVLAKVEQATIVRVESVASLGETLRGSGGFGHTGV